MGNKVFAVYEGPSVRGASYITPGRKYPVTSEIENVLFHILDNDGDELICRWKECAHLNNANWTRFEEEETQDGN